MCIEEGDVGRVGCPDPECVKKGNEASEEEVARVVTETELQRWKWLREKRTYDRGISHFIPSEALTLQHGARSNRCTLSSGSLSGACSEAS